MVLVPKARIAAIIAMRRGRDAALSASRIRIDAGGGSDTVSVANNVPIRTTVTGGAGADKLTSGSKRTLLSGGGGGDRLFSRSRHGGTLDGGKGADRYYNRFGEIQVMARADGDRVMVNDAAVKVAQPGVFGFSGTSTNPGKSYFLTEGDEGQTDLLA
jgi:Ca2+-binding RTX toxin-like protein